MGSQRTRTVTLASVRRQLEAAAWQALAAGQCLDRAGHVDRDVLTELVKDAAVRLGATWENAREIDPIVDASIERWRRRQGSCAPSPARVSEAQDLAGAEAPVPGVGCREGGA